VDDSSLGALTAAGLPCGSCGTELPPNSKFCNECGAPVTQVSRSAEYKQVTVLFADVVHSMNIAAAVGAERLREIMADLADHCAAVVQRYGGTVDKFTGDGNHGGVWRANRVGGPRFPRLYGRRLLTSSRRTWCSPPTCSESSIPRLPCRESIPMPVGDG
jgi:hypothetical protein